VCGEAGGVFDMVYVCGMVCVVHVCVCVCVEGHRRRLGRYQGEKCGRGTGVVNVSHFRSLNLTLQAIAQQ
jgi:hypothetical protein